MTNIYITNSADLANATETLHDFWFDVEDVAYIAQTRLLVVRFAEKQIGLSKRRYDVELTVHAVASYEIVDTEKIGCYDLNRISFNPSSKRLEFECNIPLSFTAIVDWPS
jgi:hypothetical protein